MSPSYFKNQYANGATALEVAQTMHKQAKGAFLSSVVLMTCATIAVVWTAGSLEKQLLSLSALIFTMIAANQLRRIKLDCQELICRLPSQTK
ncbi:MAG: hypothetical protein ABJJ69_20290 [Paracoccaceae bacterium]